MPRYRRLRVALAAGLVCLLLVSTLGVALADTFRVRGLFDGGRYLWQPKARSIAVGDTIRWKAVEGNHNVKSRGANWSYFRNLPQGTSVARTFNRRGTFRYYCTIHGSVQNGVCSGMCGRIVVG
jgi:plastocyanin